MTTVNVFAHEAAKRTDARTSVSPRLARLVHGERFGAALASLAIAYAFSWVEFGLVVMMGLPGDAGSHPLAAAVVSRVLVGVLYLCVASRLQWARWLTVAFGFASVALVAPTLALQWQVFPAAAVVSGVALVCRLSASIFLLSPLPERSLANEGQRA